MAHARPTDVITLIGVTSGKNAQHAPIEVPLPGRNVHATKQSIKQSQFYQAAATGLKPEWVFTIWTREYNNEKKLIHNGKPYNIIRTYDRDDERTELTVEGVVNRP